MRYVLLTAATSDPVSVAEAKTHCRIDSSSEDAYIRQLISSATRYVERRISRQFCEASWTLYLDCFAPEIVICKLPVMSITTVKYYDLGGTLQTLAAATYQSDIVSPDAPGRLMPAYGYGWPSVREDTYNAVQIAFKAGYGDPEDVPQAAKRAILLLVSQWYENREPMGLLSSPMEHSLDAILAEESWGAYA
jgi:uncharacterized phiE125 gp8 family phage protein